MSLRDELLNPQFQNNTGVDCKKAHDWAKVHKNSELHSRLQWDDGKAGYEYRLIQIRRLVSLTIGINSKEPIVVNLRIDRQHGGGYRKITDVKSDKDLTLLLLQDAIAELNHVRAKYLSVKQLISVWAALDKVQAKSLPKGPQPKTRRPPKVARA